MSFFMFCLYFKALSVACIPLAPILRRTRG